MCLARVHRVHRNPRVPVIHRGADDGIDVFLLKQLSVIVKVGRAIRGVLGFLQTVFGNVADAPDRDIIRLGIRAASVSSVN